MSKKLIDLPLSNLAHGAIQEKLDGELEKVFANIRDYLAEELEEEVTSKRITIIA